MKDIPILIIDDNPLNLKMVAYLLASKKYAVHTAVNAEEALKILTHLEPKIILMDLQLPGMDGLELTRKLKADPKYQKVPIIAITAYAMKGDKEKALSAGCDAYIPKPIDTRALPTLIEEFLRKNDSSIGNTTDLAPNDNPG